MIDGLGDLLPCSRYYYGHCRSRRCCSLLGILIRAYRSNRWPYLNGFGANSVFKGFVSIVCKTTVSILWILLEEFHCLLWKNCCRRSCRSIRHCRYCRLCSSIRQVLRVLWMMNPGLVGLFGASNRSVASIWSFRIDLPLKKRDDPCRSCRRDSLYRFEWLCYGDGPNSRAFFFL